MERYIVISNTETGRPEMMRYCPFGENTKHILHFIEPTEYLTVEEFYALTDYSTVITLIVKEPLPDYDVLKKCVNVRCLFIYEAKALKDLSFVDGMLYLQQLLIDRVSFSNITPLTVLCDRKDAILETVPENERDRYILDAVYLIPCKDGFPSGRDLLNKKCVDDIFINYTDYREAEKKGAIN